VLTGEFPNCDVKLCDFGISRYINGTDVREILGTPDYVGKLFASPKRKRRCRTRWETLLMIEFRLAVSPSCRFPSGDTAWFYSGNERLHNRTEQATLRLETRSPGWIIFYDLSRRLASQLRALNWGLTVGPKVLLSSREYGRIRKSTEKLTESPSCSEVTAKTLVKRIVSVRREKKRKFDLNSISRDRSIGVVTAWRSLAEISEIVRAMMKKGCRKRAERGAVRSGSAAKWQSET